MKLVFCTITTKSHLYKTKALIESVKRYIDIEFIVLVTDAIHIDNDATYLEISSIKSELGIKIISKYKKYPDKLRWALKPVLMIELLEKKYDKVIYTDNDIFFYSSPQFLYDKLDESNILLTPQNYSFDPTQKQDWLESNYLCGLFNAGFIGASKRGIDALKWWGECCLYNMKKVAWRGLFDDQKYLDLMPIIFENIEIVKHKGCNITGWNMPNNIRVKTNAGTVMFPNYPIVFIHYTPLFFFNMRYRLDELLRDEYNEYLSSLKKYNTKFTLESQYRRKLIDYWWVIRYRIWSLVRWIEK